ncbi:MAG TPA: hypothetical protein VGN88_10550 [Phycisphaerae bacterium]|jgi:hypothetical protein
MVIENANQQEAMPAEGAAEGNPNDDGERDGGEAGEAIPELFKSLKRVIKLQVRIWLTHAKRMMLQTAVVAAAGAVCVVLAILAIVFLYIGVFHVLTDILHIAVAWSFLIFSGLHVAGILVIVGIVMQVLRGRGGAK